MRVPAVAQAGRLLATAPVPGNSFQAERATDTRTGIPHSVYWLSEA